MRLTRCPMQICSPRPAVAIRRQFSAAEVAGILDTTPASVNSALQRARKVVDQRVPAPSQQAELDALGTDGCRELVDAFVTAWERADVPALVDLLAEDAQFTVPPLPATCHEPTPLMTMTSRPLRRRHTAVGPTDRGAGRGRRRLSSRSRRSRWLRMNWLAASRTGVYSQEV